MSLHSKEQIQIKHLQWNNQAPRGLRSKPSPFGNHQSCRHFALVHHSMGISTQETHCRLVTGLYFSISTLYGIVSFTTHHALIAIVHNKRVRHTRAQVLLSSLPASEAIKVEVSLSLHDKRKSLCLLAMSLRIHHGRLHDSDGFHGRKSMQEEHSSLSHLNSLTSSARTYSKFSANFQ